MKGFRYATLLVALAPVFAAGNATAIPLFAHKYHTTCFTCHTTPPLLNEFGRRFQANGYQIPGTNERIALWDQPMFAFGAVAQPLVARTSTWDNLGDSSLGSSTDFTGIEVGLFSSGSLGPHWSYFAAVPVAISDGQTSIDIETANIMYTDVLNDGTGSVNLRLGKFRFYLPFMANTMLANPNIDPVVYGYDPFAITGNPRLVTANDFSIAEPTFGASAFGMIPGIADGLRWEAGITGGNNSDIDLSQAKAFFFALDQTVFVNEAPVRFGGFYYTGDQNVTDTSTLASWTNHPNRYGVDAELYDPWMKRLDFFGEYTWAKDDNVDTVGTAYNMSGGFAGLNVIVLPQLLYVYGRYDFQHIKETNDQTNQIDMGIQYNLLPNVFLTGIYTITNDKIPSVKDITSTNFGAGVRFGF